jgi:hypothetical protein
VSFLLITRPPGLRTKSSKSISVEVGEEDGVGELEGRVVPDEGEQGETLLPSMVEIIDGGAICATIFMKMNEECR